MNIVDIMGTIFLLLVGGGLLIVGIGMMFKKGLDLFGGRPGSRLFLLLLIAAGSFLILLLIAG